MTRGCDPLLGSPAYDTANAQYEQTVLAFLSKSLTTAA